MILQTLKQKHIFPYVANTSWLLADNVVRIVVGIGVNTYIVRYLGPSPYGKLALALSIITLFTVLADVGLRLVVLKDLIKEPSKSAEILATAFAIKLCGGILSAVMAMGTIVILRPADQMIWMMVGGMSLMYLFQSFDVIELWFQAQVKSKFTVIARTTAFLSISIVRIWLVFIHSSLTFFALTYALESLLIATGLFWNYRRQHNSLRLGMPSRKWAQDLLSSSWPVLLTGFAIYFQTYIDQIMLGQLAGDGELGQFSAAFNLIVPLDFIPLAVVNTLAPEIMKAKSINTVIYSNRLIKSYRLLVLLFLTIAVPILVFGQQLVNILYGSDFHQAGIIFSFLSVRIFFFNLSAVKYQFLMVENLFLYTFWVNLAGAVIKVILNFLLIPSFKSFGVIFSMIVAYAVTVFLSDIFHRQTRWNLRLMAQAIITPWKVL